MTGPVSTPRRIWRPRVVLAVLVGVLVGMAAGVTGVGLPNDLGGIRSAWAVDPDEMLSDPALEQRARDISQGLRCVVCQSENIDESNADLAKDMRVRVRDLLQEGYSNDAVVDYMVDRYGDYVLMKPPFKATTLALWLGPAVVLVLGLAGILVFYRRRGGLALAAAGTGEGAAIGDPDVPPLSEAERRRLNSLLGDDPGSATGPGPGSATGPEPGPATGPGPTTGKERQS